MPGGDSSIGVAHSDVELIVVATVKDSPADSFFFTYINILKVNYVPSILTYH